MGSVKSGCSIDFKIHESIQERTAELIEDWKERNFRITNVEIWTKLVDKQFVMIYNFICIYIVSVYVDLCKYIYKSVHLIKRLVFCIHLL